MVKLEWTKNTHVTWWMCCLLPLLLLATVLAAAAVDVVRQRRRQSRLRCHRRCQTLYFFFVVFICRSSFLIISSLYFPLVSVCSHHTSCFVTQSISLHSIFNTNLCSIMFVYVSFSVRIDLICSVVSLCVYMCVAFVFDVVNVYFNY